MTTTILSAGFALARGENTFAVPTMQAGLHQVSAVLCSGVDDEKFMGGARNE